MEATNFAEIASALFRYRKGLQIKKIGLLSEPLFFGRMFAMKRTLSKKDFYGMVQARRRLVRRVFLAILAFYVSMNLILSFCVSPVKQNSDSMEPTIKRSSYSLASPIPLTKNIRRGEVVLVDRDRDEAMPLQKRAADIVLRAVSFQKKRLSGESREFLARVVGLPGDTIFMKDFVLNVSPKGQPNGKSFQEFELTRIIYTPDIRRLPHDWNRQIGVRGNFDRLTLGDDEFFVLCDNRHTSLDSRVFGPIKASNIKKRVIVTYFPFRNFRLFRTNANKNNQEL